MGKNLTQERMTSQAIEKTVQQKGQAVWRADGVLNSPAAFYGNTKRADECNPWPDEGSPHQPHHSYCF